MVWCNADAVTSARRCELKNCRVRMMIPNKAAIAVLFLSIQFSDCFTAPSTLLLHRDLPSLTLRKNYHKPISTGSELRSSLRADSTAQPSSLTANGESDSAGATDSASQSGNEENKFSWTEQWYPILPESYLQDQPIPVTILDRDLVIWKTASGEVSVLEDSCPHRRAPLSTGKIVNGQLACRYHGWQFDSTGSCTNIPMDGSQKFGGKFCTKSYNAQIKGGLLWVFMSPDVSNPPQISQDIVNDDTSGGWMTYVSPVSFLSQIENSFDPTHAPFTHEGSNSFGSEGFSPENALPMERYELIEPLTKDGFELEHSPYQKMDPGVPEVTTTRRFVAPCTTVVKSPFFSTNLHFVPSKSGETLVVINFAGGGPKKSKGVQKILRRMIPEGLKSSMKDFVHYAIQISESRFKFASQDQLTMQGQDYNKMKDNKWSDMAPTVSDAGVKALQRWMSRYGNFGPFPIQSLSAHQRSDMSIWDSHGKFCPQCRATIKRLARLEKVASKISAFALGASLFGGAMSSFLLAVQKSTSRASLGLLIPTVTLLVLSAVVRALSQLCGNLIARSFVTREANARLRTMEIYPN